MKHTNHTQRIQRAIAVTAFVVIASVFRSRRRILAVVVAAVLCLGASTLVSPEAAFASNGGILNPGEYLHTGQYVTSPAGYFKLLMQGDGNLVAYLDPAVYPPGTKYQVPIWSSHSAGHPGAYALMRNDGNLVVQIGTTVLFQTHTSGHPGAYAKMKDDGNIVAYSLNNSVLWQSHTAGTTISSPVGGYCKGNLTWLACLNTTVWHNGAHAGIRTRLDRHATCTVQTISFNFVCRKIGEGSSEGSYPTSSTTKGAYNEDWYNVQIEHKAPIAGPSTYECVYLRIDTTLNGDVTAQKPVRNDLHNYDSTPCK
jgi:hypothetical protein